MGTLFLLIYSITNRTSFEMIKFLYRDLITIKEEIKFPIIIIGNMSDLDMEREISFEEGKKWADDQNLPFIETSAAIGRNVYFGFVFLFYYFFITFFLFILFYLINLI